MSSIKPCPICGEINLNTDDFDYIECMSCGFVLSIYDIESDANLKDAWNHYAYLSQVETILRQVH